jgi:hypothetical protein
MNIIWITENKILQNDQALDFMGYGKAKIYFVLFGKNLHFEDNSMTALAY